MLRASLVAVVLFTGAARADGIYFKESFGVGRARGALAPLVGNALHTRLGVGARLGWVAIEPWLGTDLQTEREGAFKGLVGGEPAEGLADLAQYGIDLKAIASLHQTADVVVESYVRGGASLAGGTGALDGYSGEGLGIGAGMQLRGRVRALGFLWAPLFFAKRGPKLTGALFIDQGYEFVWLRHRDAMPVTARVGSISVGFAVGSAF
jgi:hypothetical protein